MARPGLWRVAGNVTRSRLGQLDYGFVVRGTWFALVALGAAHMALSAPWDAEWAGWDLSNYLAGGGALPDPYTDTGYLYSPAFAVLVAPLNVLPVPLVVTLWRIAELVALALAVRGTVAGWAVFLIPGFWWSEMVVCNVSGFATAAMIAVLRWPSVRTVACYALFVAMIPKPTFLPVLAWAFVTVPAARRWVVVAGAIGVAMLPWPGYIEAISANGGYLANFHWPQPWGYVAAALVTLIGVRYTRLLWPAALLATPYMFPYSSTVVGTSFVKSRHIGHVVRWPLRSEPSRSTNGAIASG
jgi:hypothetical protein